MRRRYISMVLVATAALAMAGCDEDPTSVPIVNPAPTITAVTPDSITAGSGGANLVVVGSGFTPDSRVVWNDDERVTTYIDAGELRASITSQHVAVVGSASVRVVTPQPGGGTSSAFTITIAAPPPGPVAVVELDADSLTVAEGSAAQLSATARDSLGTVVTGRAVQWTSSDPEVGYIAANGLVTGLRPGTVTVTARVDGTTASIPVRVFADYPYELVFTGWGESSTQPHLYRVDLSDSTGTPVLLGMDGPAGNPTPSPSGSRIAYIGTDGFEAHGIYVADVDGGSRVLLVDTGAETCGQLSWSPDGERLAFACGFGGDDLDIWVMDGADGSGLTNLTDSQPGKQEHPSWSPALADGSTRIAYAQYVNGEPQIWTMAAGGTDHRQVTNGFDAQPAWSPDGTTIAFQRTGAAIFGDIWLVDADGGNERGLVGTHLAGPQWSPSWSPDGLLVAFSSTHETYGSGGTMTSHIYTVRTDGTGRLARRTTGPLDKQAPAWRSY